MLKAAATAGVLHRHARSYRRPASSRIPKSRPLRRIIALGPDQRPELHLHARFETEPRICRRVPESVRQPERESEFRRRRRVRRDERDLHDRQTSRHGNLDPDKTMRRCAECTSRARADRCKSMRRPARAVENVYMRRIELLNGQTGPDRDRHVPDAEDPERTLRALTGKRWRQPGPSTRNCGREPASSHRPATASRSKRFPNRGSRCFPVRSRARKTELARDLNGITSDGTAIDGLVPARARPASRCARSPKRSKAFAASLTRASARRFVRRHADRVAHRGTTCTQSHAPRRVPVRPGRRPARGGARRSCARRSARRLRERARRDEAQRVRRRDHRPTGRIRRVVLLPEPLRAAVGNANPGAGSSTVTT